MSAARKGRRFPQKTPRSGRPHSEETKSKLAGIQRGKKLSDETKAKMSASRKGVLKTETAKRNMSDALRDTTRPGYRTRSEATSRSNTERQLSGKDFNVKGYYIPQKGSSVPIPYRSSLELRLMQAFDEDFQVTTWKSPCIVRYISRTGAKLHTLPDFLVTYFDGSMKVVEAKGPHLMKAYLEGEKFSAVVEWAKSCGHSFVVVTTQGITSPLITHKVL